MNAKEKVDASKVVYSINSVAKQEKIRAGRRFPITTVGFYLALCVLGYLAVVTIAIFVDYFLHAPQSPPASASSETLEAYKTLSQISSQRMTSLFELMVEKTMLPVLTAILGYIFGVRESGSNTNTEDED